MIAIACLIALGSVVPPAFVENRGQWDGEIRFALLCDSGVAAFVTARGIGVVVSDGEERTSFVLRPESSSPLDPRGEDRAQGVLNFLIGSDPAGHVRDARLFHSVRCRGIAPGVDLVVRAATRGIEYDVELASGADAGSIVFALDGATLDGATIAGQDGGVLEIATALDAVRHGAPRAFAVDARGDRSAVRATTRAISDRRFAFDVGSTTGTLVVDPVIEFVTWLGGGAADNAVAVATGPAGAVYVAGTTSSIDFPTTPGAIDRVWNTMQDAFAAKLDGGSGALAWATYLGGSSLDNAYKIAVDSQGVVVVAGRSSSPNFPTTSGAFQQQLDANYDSFVSKLAPDGASFVASTLLGGFDIDYVRGLALTANGSVAIAGHTHSSNFPVTPGAYDTQLNGHAMFVARLAPSLNSLAFATFLGGTNDDHAYSLSIGPGESLFVAGACEANFPFTANAWDASIGGGTDGVFVQLNAAGSQLLYSTAFGGTGAADPVSAVATDPDGRAVIAGITVSTDLPLLPNALDSTLGGIADGYVAVIDPVSGSLVAATYLGGSNYDTLQGLALTPGGSPWVCGIGGAGYPVTADAIDSTVSGAVDLFVTRLDPALSTILYSSVHGGSQNDGAHSVAVDPTGRIVLAGDGASSDYPGTAGSAQPQLAGGVDAIVLSFDGCAGSFTASPSACPGSGFAAPAVAGLGCPMPGFSITITASATAGSSGILFVGLGSLSLPLNPSCSLTIGPLSSIVVPLAFPTGQPIALPAALPAMTPSADIWLQLIVTDPPAQGGLAASDPLLVAIRP